MVKEIPLSESIYGKVCAELRGNKLRGDTAPNDFLYYLFDQKCVT